MYNRGLLILSIILSGFVPVSAQQVQFQLQWLDAEESVPVAEPLAFQLDSGDEEPSWLEEFFTPAQEEKSTGEKLLYLAGSTVAFALFDYLWFNSVRTDPDALKIYRVAQVAAQAGITYYLYKEVSASTAIGFNLVWWTFGADLVYFGFAELFNVADPWENRGDFSKNVMGNHATWAYWTPIGISRGMKRKTPIAGDTLIAQALVGAALAVTVTVSF